jgi:S1-C subfamily serine protease/HEAT repeat protein
MPLPRTCPECRANLAFLRPAANGKLRCPECGTIFSSERGDGRLQAAPGTRRAASLANASSRSRDADEEPVVRKQKSSLLIVLLLLGLGLGFVLLLAVGGSLAAFLYFGNTTPKPSPVASSAVDAPAEAMPVAHLEPAPAPAMEPIQPAPQEQGAKGTLPLKELKAASVYIKARTATMGSRGSGFVIQAQGGTVYVATNHHVISPPKENADLQPPLGFPPGIIGPRMPGMPFGPRRPRRGIALDAPFAAQGVALTVVFHSGTAKEQELAATVVADNAEDDLAVLRATGVTDAPRPIAYQRTPELMETMAVTAFGFPFGEQLDKKKKNPAVTVTKGVISALRVDRGEVDEVQLDLDLNPGNSGGPVVDEKGALIGVAVAKVNNTRIGFAVPVPKLHRLLQGRIDPPALFQEVTIQGRKELRVVALAVDPLGKLRSPTLLYGPANEMQMPRKGVNGWDRLFGAKSSDLTIQGTQATAPVALTVPASGELKILAQVSYRTASGQTILSEPRTLSLGATNAPPGGTGVPPVVVNPPNIVQPPAVAARPVRAPKGEELTKLLADLKSADEATRQRAASTLQQMPPRQRRDEVRRGLQALLTSAAPATRAAGVQALTACDPKEAAPSVAKLIADEVPLVRQAVVKSLKELKDARVAEAVAARLPVEPLSVLDVLKAIGPAAEKAVLPYLADKYAGGTRFWTFNVLTEIGTSASIPALEAVQGPDALHARNVLQTIRGRLPLSADEWPAALDDLKSTDTARRTRASRRIAATPPNAERRAEVVSRLEWLLNDQSGDVRIAAIKGLARWSGKSAIPMLAKRLEGFDPGLHAAIIDVLAEMKSDEAAAAIAKRLPDVHDRGKATQTLKKLDAKVAEKAVLPLLANTDVFVRCEAVKVLADVGGRDSIAPLEKLAGDNNVFYSGPARQALESIKDRTEDEK